MTPVQIMTFAEFKGVPDVPGYYLELHHGELVRMSFPSLSHGEAQYRLQHLVESAAGSAGVVRIEMPYRPESEYEAWRADVAYVSKSRWNPELQYMMGAPDLVIEILSPSNTAAELNEKKELCLENGAREFWVVDLDRRRVDVSTPDGHTITYRPGQEIPLFFSSGERLAVDAVFA